LCACIRLLCQNRRWWLQPLISKVIRAFLCDARERDLEPLEVQDSAVRVVMPGTVSTIRLLQS
jgi:hypothetical protein